MQQSGGGVMGSGEVTGAGEEVASEELTLIYDTDLRAPACVLLQAAFGCGSSPRALRHFESRHWLTAPTPGMKRLSGTDEVWKRVAEVTRTRWGDAPARAGEVVQAAAEPALVPRRRQGIKQKKRA